MALVNSKLWWMKCSKTLLDLNARRQPGNFVFTPNKIDPCVFQLKEEATQKVMGFLLTHIDDLMFLVEPNLDKSFKEEIQKRFPVDE